MKKTKKCTKCHVRKPLAAFSKNASKKDGLQTYCKECTKVYHDDHYEEWRVRNARYYAGHCEEWRVRNARYQAKHREEARVYSAQYRMLHLEECRARDARYCAEHRNEACMRAARWHKAHPELARAQTRRRRARKRSVSEHFTPEMEQFIRMSWGAQCAFCGSTRKLHIDHWRSLSRGHALTLNNAVLLCKSCNSSKGTKLPEKLANQVQVVAIEQRLVEQAERWEDCERLAVS